jgi:hypothetical protein
MGEDCVEVTDGFAALTNLDPRRKSIALVKRLERI